MEQTRYKLERQHHELVIPCNEQDNKYILGRDARRAQDVDANSTFIRCISEFVSRKHTEICFDGYGVWKIKDLGSMNGTFLNEARLALGQQRELRDGDIVGLGIRGAGPVEEDIIDLAEERYFIFKFVEIRGQDGAELIDLTDPDDACTVIASSSKPSFLSKENIIKIRLGHGHGQSSSASSVKSDATVKDYISQKHASRAEHRRNEETDSVKSRSSSKGSKHLQSPNSRSRPISPVQKSKMSPHKKRHFAVTSSEDDSSDGLPEIQIIEPKEPEPEPVPFHSFKKPGSSHSHSSEQLNDKGRVVKVEYKKNLPKEEKFSHSIKPLQSLNQVSKGSVVKKETKQKTNDSKVAKIGSFSTVFKQCSVKLTNIIQVDRHGRLSIVPTIYESVFMKGCHFSQDPISYSTDSNTRGPAKASSSKDDEITIDISEALDIGPSPNLLLLDKAPAVDEPFSSPSADGHGPSTDTNTITSEPAHELSLPTNCLSGKMWVEKSDSDSDDSRKSNKQKRHLKKGKPLPSDSEPEVKRYKENDDDDFVGSRKSKKNEKPVFKKIIPIESDSDSDDPPKELLVKLPPIPKQMPYRPGPKSRAQAYVKPMIKHNEDDARGDFTKNILRQVPKLPKENIMYPPMEYSRNSNDEDGPTANGYSEELKIDVDNEHNSDPPSPEDDMDVDVEDEDGNEAEVVPPEDYANDDSLSRLITHSKTRLAPQQRQIKLLDEAPSPIANRRRQGISVAERVSAVPSGALREKSHVSDWVSVDPMSDAKKKAEQRKRLKEISWKELKEKAERERQRPEDDIFKKPQFVPKVKNSSKSRSESLLQSMVGSSAALENLEKKIEAAPGPAPRELPRPSAEVAAKMPLNVLLNSDLSLPQTAPTARNQKIVPPMPRSNLLQKPNAIISPQKESNSNDKVQFRIHNKQILPPTKQSHTRGVLLEDSIYKDICTWNASWLQEQKDKSFAPPPVECGVHRPAWKVISVLNSYDDYETYQSVFYPLMLHELWASIYDDWVEGFKSCELKVGIESVQYPEICPKFSQSALAPTIDPSNAQQGFWHLIKCHVLINNKRDIRNDIDLCLFTFTFKLRDKNNQEVIVEKTTFAFMLANSDSTEEINSKTIVSTNLYQQNPHYKLKHSFSIFFFSKSNKFNIVPDRICILKKFTYVSSKVREYQSLTGLHRSPLFHNVLTPQRQEAPWVFNEHTGYDSLVPYCNSLNPRQKSVVDYVSNRVMRTKGKSDIMLIHGPPGTGKTRTIVGLILQILTNQAFKHDCPRILVCTPSNTAIDEIVARLHDTMLTMKEEQRPSMIRIGDNVNQYYSKISELGSTYTVDYIAKKRIKSSSAVSCIDKEISEKIKEIEEKEREKSELMKDPSKSTRVKALERQIKEIQNWISQQENSKKTVIDAARSDSEKLDRMRNEIYHSANIVCSTLSSCSNSKLKNIFDVVGKKYSSRTPPKFTCCIVDEATQTTEPESLAPLTFNIDKLILVGDPMQLDATVKSQKAKDNYYCRSLFHRLYETYNKQYPNPVMLLREQYRMHEEILKWPNDMFYNGSLITKPIRKNVAECPLPPYLFFNLTSRETGDNGQISNEDETMLVIEILKSIWTQLDVKFSIGVITPYSNQKKMLLKSIKEKVPALSNIVEVDTVDSFQGREKDIILISCVRTDKIGFLNNPKRLNVALTRAVHSLFIIGNAQCLKKDETWESLIEDAENRKVAHVVPTDKTKQPGLLASLLRPILTTPNKSVNPEERRRISRM